MNQAVDDKFNIQENKLKALQDNIDTTTEMFTSKLNFMVSRMESMIDTHIKIKLDDEGFRAFLIDKTKEFVHDNMDMIIKKVVEETVARVNKNIKYELIVTRQLCQSIDSEVKHTIRDMDCSYESDKLIAQKIDEHVNRFLCDKKQMKILLLEAKNEKCM